MKISLNELRHAIRHEVSCVLHESNDDSGSVVVILQISQEFEHEGITIKRAGGTPILADGTFKLEWQDMDSEALSIELQKLQRKGVTHVNWKPTPYKRQKSGTPRKMNNDFGLKPGVYPINKVINHFYDLDHDYLTGF